MPGVGPRARYWCLTLNNYIQQDVDRLSQTTALPGVEYMVFGKEVDASGTPNLEGIVCFQSRKRMSTVKAVIGQAEFSTTRYPGLSTEYCKKDGDFMEIGIRPRFIKDVIKIVWLPVDLN
jgi:Putative viral replication protein